MKNRRTLNTAALILGSLIFISALLFGRWNRKTEAGQNTMTFEEYLRTGREQWFLTGKKEYGIQGMMVSKETSFHNDYENIDYTVNDDGTSVVLKGTAGEMWVSALSKVQNTYVKKDGSKITEADFAVRDVFIGLVSVPSPNSCYAMHVPEDASVTVTTSSGYELHTNLPGLDHGGGDYILSSVTKEGTPDLSDVWAVNGVLFKNCYDPVR